MGILDRKGGSGQSSNFTNAENLKNNFFAKAKSRIKAKEENNSKFANDAGYWNGGQCNWGLSHNLQEDCETLANFFNSIANIADSINEIRLSANETIFNQKKQSLINKIQGLSNKCRATSATSVAGVCIIWNDFFGSFLKKFLNGFSSKLTRQLSAVEKLEPKHQQELLQLEKEAREAESAYKENLQKANNETDETKKAEFIVLANRNKKKADEIKRKVRNNPIAQATDFNFLDDLEILTQGNVPSNVTPDKNPKKDKKDEGGKPTPDPIEDPQGFFEQYQTKIFIVLSLIIIFIFIYTQKDEEDEDTKEDKKLLRQMMLMKTMNKGNEAKNNE